MKVKKTLHQIYMDISQLREERDISARVVAKGLIKGRSADRLLDEYKHFDEVIKYLSQIEVEYEDKYATEEEEE